MPSVNEIFLYKIDGMKNLYYNVWSDAINSFRKHHPEITDWKVKVFNLMTFTNALNFWILFFWLQYFGLVRLPKFTFNLPIGIINDFLMFILIFALPFVIINFFLIFYKDRYKNILEKYPYTDKKYAIKYSFIILALMAFTIFLSSIL